VPVTVQGGSVNGNVSITNTPNVSVVNIPSVKIEAGDPVSGTCSDTVGSKLCVLYTVPAGKRLVVQQISYHVVADPSAPAFLIIFGRLHSNTIFLCFGCDTMAFSPLFSAALSTTYRYADTRLVRYYVDEGDSFIGQLGFNGANNFAQTISFSGSLVDK
jgi:hypothetical protein